jgi:hypothetical protein
VRDEHFNSAPPRFRGVVFPYFIFFEEVLKGLFEELVQAHALLGSEYLERSQEPGIQSGINIALV